MASSRRTYPPDLNRYARSTTAPRSGTSLTWPMPGKLRCSTRTRTEFGSDGSDLDQQTRGMHPHDNQYSAADRSGTSRTAGRPVRLRTGRAPARDARSAGLPQASRRRGWRTLAGLPEALRSRARTRSRARRSPAVRAGVRTAPGPVRGPGCRTARRSRPRFQTAALGLDRHGGHALLAGLTRVGGRFVPDPDLGPERRRLTSSPA